MAKPSEIKKAAKQEFSADSPVINLVEGVDYIFNKLGISKSSCRSPSGPNESDQNESDRNEPNQTGSSRNESNRNESNQNESGEKVAGMTNVYLKPTRIGRKAVLGNADFFYGRKFNLMPNIYEMVPYDAPADVFAFVENRLRETLTDYMSIHNGNFRLNLDIKDGVITDLAKMGFDGQFSYLSNNTILTFGDLTKVIHSLLETS